MDSGGEIEVMDELVDLTALPVLPASRRFASLLVQVIRPIGEDDLLDLLTASDEPGPTALSSIRHTHHRLAQMICEGKAPVEISMLTGYSPGYIRRLQDDPAFRELLAYYGANATLVHTETMERLITVGTMALEELQERLETDPKSWSRRELMEFMDKTLVAPAKAASLGPGAGGGPAVAINVQFVSSLPVGPEGARPVEGEVKRVPREQEI